MDLLRYWDSRRCGDAVAGSGKCMIGVGGLGQLCRCRPNVDRIGWWNSGVSGSRWHVILGRLEGQNGPPSRRRVCDTHHSRHPQRIRSIRHPSGHGWRMALHSQSAFGGTISEYDHEKGWHLSFLEERGHSVCTGTGEELSASGGGGIV